MEFAVQSPNGSEIVLPGSCAVNSCDRPYFAAGYCNAHYKRKWRHGDPLAGAPMRGVSLAEQAARYYTEGDGCWEWTGNIDRMGYGTLTSRHRTRRAHRVVFAIHHGLDYVVPELDHLCRNKRCVNPAHLEPVSHSENLRRHYAAITECPHGHAYDEANTYRDTSGKRRCRTCLRERQRARRAAARS